VIAKFDGKDNMIHGVQRSTVNRRAYKRIDERTFDIINKTDGKVTTTSRNVISPDGKTMTQTTKGVRLFHPRKGWRVSLATRHFQSQCGLERSRTSSTLSPAIPSGF
jgi:hypothetical protein